MAPVQTARPAGTPRSPRAVLRGLVAVAALFAGAADALVTALLGLPRMAWVAQRIAAAAGEEYRRGAWGAIDVEEVIDEPGPGRDDRTQDGGTP